MGKSTISMVIFNSYVSLPEGSSGILQDSPWFFFRDQFLGWSTWRHLDSPELVAPSAHTWPDRGTGSAVPGSHVCHTSGNSEHVSDIILFWMILYNLTAFKTLLWLGLPIIDWLRGGFPVGTSIIYVVIEAQPRPTGGWPRGTERLGKSSGWSASSLPYRTWAWATSFFWRKKIFETSKRMPGDSPCLGIKHQMLEINWLTFFGWGFNYE